MLGAMNEVKRIVLRENRENRDSYIPHLDLIYFNLLFLKRSDEFYNSENFLPLE
jgi:hypothetical protein